MNTDNVGSNFICFSMFNSGTTKAAPTVRFSGSLLPSVNILVQSEQFSSMWAVLVALIMISSPSFWGPKASCRSDVGGVICKSHLSSKQCYG